MYKIIYEDESTFVAGKDLENSKWNEMPDKPIRRIEYTLLNRTLILENYEEYNHLVMKASVLFSKLSGVIKVILVTKEKENINKFTFNLLTNQIILDENCEDKKSSSTGWKKGIADLNPTYKLL